MKMMTMNQKTALTDASPSPHDQQPRGLGLTLLVDVSACCAIVLLSARAGGGLAYMIVSVPVIVVGWTWQRTCSRRPGPGRVLRVWGPLKNAVSPIGTGLPSGR